MRWILIPNLSLIFFQVTCGSAVKLMNVHRSIRLHSHDVKYGSGSGQQSVTGTDSKDDVNSHWAVKGPTAKKFCNRGIPVGESRVSGCPAHLLTMS